MARDDDISHEEDDFSFPEEGEYQFDETHDFEDNEDYGLSPDEPAEPEPAVTPAAKRVEPPVEMSAPKRVAGGEKESNKKPAFVIGALVIFLVVGYVMFKQRSTNISLPANTAPPAQQKTLPQKKAPSQPATAQTQSTPTTNTPVSLPAPGEAQNQNASSTTSPLSPQTPDLQQNQSVSTNTMNPMGGLEGASNERLSTLETQTSTLWKNVGDLKNTEDKNIEALKNLENSVTALAVQTQRLNQALLLIANAATQQKSMPPADNNAQGATGNMSQPMPSSQPAQSQTTLSRVYTVDAVIPGRAWLKNKAGDTSTVAQGDTIPGYGKVTVIDDENGIVITSNGTRFEYGAH